MAFHPFLPLNPFLLIKLSVGKRLKHRATLLAAFRGSVWLSLDHVARMLAGLLVGVWMARYLGPEQFGWLTYAAATVGLIGAFASLGINPIVVRELAHRPERSAEWLGAAFFLRLLGSSLGYLACVAIAFAQDAAPAPLLLIVAASLIVQVPEVIDFLFQARGMARVSALVRTGACVVATLLRVVLILADASVFTLAVAGVAELALAALGYNWALRRSVAESRPWRLNLSRVPALLQETWPLAVSGVAISIQAYADQLILGSLLGSEQLGQYAAALRLVAVFAFLPMVAQIIAAPEVARAKRASPFLYRRRLYDLYRVMLGLFVFSGLILITAGPAALTVLFGPAYGEAAMLVSWLAARLFFTNFGLARAVFLTNDGLLRFSLVTAVVGAIVNLLLNFWLVPLFGARGAIGASLLSFAVTLFVLDAFNARTRSNLRLMFRAIATPWRALKD